MSSSSILDDKCSQIMLEAGCIIFFLFYIIFIQEAQFYWVILEEELVDFFSFLTRTMRAVVVAGVSFYGPFYT